MHEVVNVVEQSLTLETSAVESLLCYLVARYLVKFSDIATILNFKKVSILFLPLKLKHARLWRPSMILAF